MKASRRVIRKVEGVIRKDSWRNQKKERKKISWWLYEAYIYKSNHNEAAVVLIGAYALPIAWSVCQVG